MRYRSTRSEEKISAPQALLQGLAKDGGLYVPEMLPVPFIEYNSLKDLSYKELASFVLKRFLTDIPENDLKKLTDAAYTGTFAAKEIVPVKRMTDAFSVAEMFYGRTCAFKDLGLFLFPYLLVWAKAQENDGKQILILTATSGDTGKAALEGFRDIPDINIMVFYPSDGVSPLQKDQMQKQSGNNVRVAGIDGNFDDAQSALKRIFMSGLREEASEKGVLFSSANSINIGRLLPQIIYYVWIWLQLRKNHSIGENERFNVVVPTGNFGNILAGWMAKEIGVPLGQLICASNENKVLTDFFETGVYDINREFYLTESPSMDILISSNLERLLYRISGDDDQKTKDMMEALKSTGKYTITEDMKARLDDFAAGYATEEECAQNIKKVYDKTGYVMDTHTSVASYVCECYQKNSGDNKKCVIASTASPYKFVKSVMSAIDPKYADQDEFSLLKVLEETSGREMPQAIKDILNANILHDLECDADKMKDTVKNILEV